MAAEELYSPEPAGALTPEKLFERRRAFTLVNQMLVRLRAKTFREEFAFLFLTIHDGGRAWKGHDGDALNRLHTKGMIPDPVGKAKSVMLTEQGEKRCEKLFLKHF